MNSEATGHGLQVWALDCNQSTLCAAVKAVAKQLGCDVWQASTHVWMHFGSDEPADAQLSESDRGYAFKNEGAAMVRWRRDEGRLWVTVLVDGAGFGRGSIPEVTAERCESTEQLNRCEQSYLLWGAPGKDRHAGMWAEDRVGAHKYPGSAAPGSTATAWLHTYEYRDEYGVLQFWLYHAFEAGNKRCARREQLACQRAR